MVDKAVAEMGRIDVLVNNAGAYPALGVLDVTEDHFNFVVNVNLKGLFFMTQAVVKKSMIPNNYGRIVNISSCDGKNPGRGVAIYSAAKAGVISLTKSFALELADYDINSNAVAARLGGVRAGAVQRPLEGRSALHSLPPSGQTVGDRRVRGLFVQRQGLLHQRRNSGRQRRHHHGLSLPIFLRRPLFPCGRRFFFRFVRATIKPTSTVR